MKNIVITLYLITVTTYAQRFVVADDISKEAVSFATASFYKSDTIAGGFYSNENGVVLSNDSLAFDRVKVSCVGYETIEVYKINLRDTIFLMPQIILLKEIVISNKKAQPKTMLLGMLKESKKLNFSSVLKGLEVVAFIKNNTSTTPLINSFLFRVKKRQKNKTAFRIHFYEKKAGKTEPGNEIVLGNIIVYRDSNSSKLLEVDISSYNLLLPTEGIFAGVEFMGVVDNGGNFIDSDTGEDHDTIEFNDAVNEPLTFSKQRFSNDESWRDTSSLKNDFVGLLTFRNWPNVSFGIKITKE